MKNNEMFSTENVRAPATPTLPNPQAKSNKTSLRIHLDSDVLIALRERADLCGLDYETLINQTLRQSLSPEAAPLTVETFRRILHEELQSLG